MRLCVISFKECWQRQPGVWYTDGGFSRQMDAIGTLFDQIDFLVVETTPRAGGQVLAQALANDARFVILKGPGPLGGGLKRKLSVILKMPHYIVTMGRSIRQADVVHVPLPGDLPLVGMTLALIFRKRLIARYGGCWDTTDATTAMNRVTRALMQRFAGGRNVMLACGEGASQPAPGVRWLFGTALTKSELDAIEPRFDRGLSADPRIIYAGRLSPEKGVANLIRALHLLRKEGFEPMPQLTIVGDGREREVLEALASEFGCDDRIRFVGQVARDTLSGYFHEADFCVQPSYTESMGKAWLDAMAHGLPVLSSAVGSAPTVFGEDGERGWIVPPGDVGALAEALKRIIREPVDWPSLRRRCRQYVEPRTLEAWGQQIAEACAARWNVRLEDGKLVA